MDTDAMAGSGGSDGSGGNTTSTGGNSTTTGGNSSEGGGAGEGGMAPGSGGSETGTGGNEPNPPDGPAICQGDGDCADLDQVCAMMRSICVDCVTSGDCDDGEVCEQNECQARPVCEDSLDCPNVDLVCVTEGGGPGPGGVCLECGSPADCEEEESCVNNVCVRGCASDKDCTPLGMLCDFDSGSCATCLNAADCADGEYCSDGTCMEAVCTPGETVCVGEDIATCNEIGSGYGDIDGCFNGACDVVDGEATCVEDGFEP